MWAGAAPGWEANADWIDEREAHVTEAMLAAVALGPGDRVLELACGPGGAGLAAAAHAGEVVLSDASEAMVDIALRRARDRGVGNVTARAFALEAIEEPDGSFDAVLCRQGLMFASDPAQAAGEIVRVLRPGGRFAIAVWASRDRNPWIGELLDAVGEAIGMAIPPPGMPGPFSLSDPDGLERLLAGAGAADVVVAEVAAPLRVASFDAYWDRVPSLAGPLAAALAAMPREQVDAIAADVRRRLERHRAGDGLELAGTALVAGGHV